MHSRSSARSSADRKAERSRGPNGGGPDVVAPAERKSVRRLRVASADPMLLFYPEELAGLAGAAAARQGCEGIVWQQFETVEAHEAPLPPAQMREATASCSDLEAR